MLSNNFIQNMCSERGSHEKKQNHDMSVEK